MGFLILSHSTYEKYYFENQEKKAKVQYQLGIKHKSPIRFIKDIQQLKRMVEIGTETLLL
jgi:hypothetical protein